MSIPYQLLISLKGLMIWDSAMEQGLSCRFPFCPKTSTKPVLTMNKLAPLLCWDFAAMQWGSSQQQYTDLEELYTLARKYDWATNLYHPLYDNFDALVVTNAQRLITWVSHGFEKMTGYAAQEAVNKHPSFLQGEATCSQAIQKISRGLKLLHPVQGTLVNYRKSGEEYLCRIEITPLFDRSNQLSHFLAVEKEIKT